MSKRWCSAGARTVPPGRSVPGAWMSKGTRLLTADPGCNAAVRRTSPDTSEVES